MTCERSATCLRSRSVLRQGPSGGKRAIVVVATWAIYHNAAFIAYMNTDTFPRALPRILAARRCRLRALNMGGAVGNPHAGTNATTTQYEPESEHNKQAGRAACNVVVSTPAAPRTGPVDHGPDMDENHGGIAQQQQHQYPKSSDTETANGLQPTAPRVGNVVSADASLILDEVVATYTKNPERMAKTKKSKKKAKLQKAQAAIAASLRSEASGTGVADDSNGPHSGKSRKRRSQQRPKPKKGGRSSAATPTAPGTSAALPKGPEHGRAGQCLEQAQVHHQPQQHPKNQAKDEGSQVVPASPTGKEARFPLAHSKIGGAVGGPVQPAMTQESETKAKLERSQKTTATAAARGNAGTCLAPSEAGSRSEMRHELPAPPAQPHNRRRKRRLAEALW